ncbi:MAG: putative sulfate/molybdate transporter [Anaerolineae bacterium]
MKWIKADRDSGQLRPFKFDLRELGGALGDLGTLLPLLVALIALNGMNPTAVLLVVGALYIVAGFYYRTPMPVQPLKVVSAIAIALGLSHRVIAAAGLWMGLILLLLAVTGAMNLIAKLFPKPVVRGIQLGLGLMLLKISFSLWSRPQIVINGPPLFVSFANVSFPAGIALAAACGILLILFLRHKWLPSSLVVLGFGTVVGILGGSLVGLTNVRLGYVPLQVGLPTREELFAALTLLVIPQLPLTLGNAVVATADVARIYFNRTARRVTHRALLTSMGLTNIVAGLIGSVAVCHGSGGLTAHYRLGARTAGSNLMIGGLCILIGLFLGNSALQIISLVPYPALGALLAYVGLQHALLARDLRQAPDIAIAALIALVTLKVGNLAIGFSSGIILYHLFRLTHHVLRITLHTESFRRSSG